jgi:hypothetical protein
MGPLRSFFGQRCPAYRDFQVIFTILTLNFAIPSLSYLFAPAVAMDQFSQLNQLLGGPAYTKPELESHFWRYLGTANVMTLALMCFLLQWNLRKFYAVLVPLTFMKGTAATLWLVGFFANERVPAFLSGAILDYVTSAAFVFFSVRAYRQIKAVPDSDLVPSPRGGAA